MRNFYMLFYQRCSKGKIFKSGKAPVYLRITIDSVRAEVHTNVNVEPAKWNSKKKEVIGKSEEVQIMNDSLRSLASKASYHYHKLIAEGKPVSAEILCNILQGKESSKKTLKQLLDYHTMLIKEKLGKGYTYSTIEKYEITSKKVLNFIQFQYKRSDFFLHELKLSFIADFEHYLRTHDNIKHNTSAKYLKNLKHVLNIAVTNDWLASNPFLNYKCGYDRTNRERLTESELELILNKQFSIPRLELVKDMYLFSCFTGLCYIDLYNLKRGNIIIGINGKPWISIQRSKTGEPSKIPLHPEAQQILKKYTSHPEINGTERVLPVPKNQKFNSYMKEIADQCGVNKNLTAHTARHTFATIALENGVPIETVSKMLGHTNLVTTQIYAKITDNKVSHDMEKIMKIFHKKQNPTIRKQKFA